MSGELGHHCGGNGRIGPFHFVWSSLDFAAQLTGGALPVPH